MIWIFTVSCNYTGSVESGPSDTAVAGTDSTDHDLVLEESVVQTAVGSRIKLMQGEWYSRATFSGYDAKRGMLVFDQENGTRREIVSNPWNRQGKMQLSANRDIKLNKGGLYELIYYFQYENPESHSNKPSGFYLIDIIPRGSYFSSEERYSATGDSTGFHFPEHSRGQFYDDLNGGAVTFSGADEKPVVTYSRLPSSEQTAVRCEPFGSCTFHVQLPDSDVDGFFHWKEGEWIYTDLEGNRRVFRTSTMQ